MERQRYLEQFLAQQTFIVYSEGTQRICVNCFLSKRLKLCGADVNGVRESTMCVHATPVAFRARTNEIQKIEEKENAS